MENHRQQGGCWWVSLSLLRVKHTKVFGAVICYFWTHQRINKGSLNKDKKENDNKGRHFPFLSHFYFLSKSQGEIN